MPLVTNHTKYMNLYFCLFNRFYSLHLFTLHNQINVCYSPQMTDIRQRIKFPFPYYWPVYFYKRILRVLHPLKTQSTQQTLHFMTMPYNNVTDESSFITAIDISQCVCCVTTYRYYITAALCKCHICSTWLQCYVDAIFVPRFTLTFLKY
jgi:hypothetical protein